MQRTESCTVPAPAVPQHAERTVHGGASGLCVCVAITAQRRKTGPRAKKQAKTGTRYHCTGPLYPIGSCCKGASRSRGHKRLTARHASALERGARAAVGPSACSQLLTSHGMGNNRDITLRTLLVPCPFQCISFCQNTRVASLRLLERRPAQPRSHGILHLMDHIASNGLTDAPVSGGLRGIPPLRSWYGWCKPSRVSTLLPRGPVMA